MSFFTIFEELKNRLSVQRLENHLFTQNRFACSNPPSFNRFCAKFQNISQKMTDFVKTKTSPYMRFKAF